MWIFFVLAEDSIRNVERSRGLGDVYRKQLGHGPGPMAQGRGSLGPLYIIAHDLDRTEIL